MGVRAPPAVASQVTSSQVLAVLDAMNVPETDLLEVDDDISVGSNLLVSDDSLNEETLQPPNLSPVVEPPQDSVADPLNPKLGQDPSNTTRKWDLPDPIQHTLYPM